MKISLHTFSEHSLTSDEEYYRNRGDDDAGGERAGGEVDADDSASDISVVTTMGCKTSAETSDKIKSLQQDDALTIYVQRHNKGYLPKGMLRFLFDNYPDLISDYEILYMKRLDTNRPIGQRSRIGDYIVVIGGEDILSKIARYPEDHVFHLSKRWRITIKGGRWNGTPGSSDSDPTRSHSTASFQSSFASKLMANLSSEAAKEASNSTLNTP